MIHKNVIKAFKFFVMRPIQRFNIENRAKKYLGPEAKKFKLAPRLISPLQEIASLPKDPNNFTIEAANSMNVLKIEESKSKTPLQISSRPLPKQTTLDLTDPRCIWQIDKVPTGRLSLDSLEELLLNQLGDPEYWTPERVADHYKIKAEYVQKIISHMKQVRIIVSPSMKKNMDYVGRDNPKYQATKHLIYHVDPRLRSKSERTYDKMYLPEDKLPDQVAEAIGQPEQVTISIEEPSKVQSLPEEPRTLTRVEQVKRVMKVPEPLRIKPLNTPESRDNPPSQQEKPPRQWKDRRGVFRMD